MAIPDDITLTPSFAATAASGLDVDSLVTADPGLTRLPRLEVPIDIQALRVSANEKVEHAGVATTATLDALTSPLGDDDPDVGAPPPFTELDPRKPGVYVHWAVPDALARADVESEDESAVRPDADAEFPALPNRWCLTRFWWVGTRYRTRSWVLEADRGRVVPLEEWEEVEDLDADDVARTPEIEPEQLTVVLGGDAAWFATFDNVEDRFAYHDDLSDLASTRDAPRIVHYTVVGWFSEDELDPLAGTTRVRGFEDRLAELGWTADTSSLPDAGETARQLSTQIDRIGLLAGDDPGPRGLHDLTESQRIPAELLAGAGIVLPTPTVYWPQRSLYHGTIYNVSLSPSSNDPDDRKPDADDVEVGLGATTTEALSALMAESIDELEERTGEQLLVALQYGLISEIESPDGPPRLAAESHRRTFESQPGGFTTERIRMGDPFAHLRRDAPADSGTTDPITDRSDDVADSGVVFEMLHADPEVVTEVHNRFVDQNRLPELDDDPLLGARADVEGGGRGPGGSYLDPLTEEGPGPELRRSKASIPTRPGIDETRVLPDSFTDFGSSVRLPNPEQAIEYRTVKRSLPRLFFPQDPAIALRGAGRGMRSRNNTVLDEEGRLVCRLSGTEADSIPGIVDGRTLMAESLLVGQVPPEARRLLDEAALNTIGGVENILSALAPTKVAKLASADAVTARLNAEDRLFERSLVPGTSAGDLATESMKDGTFPSPKSITAWQQPWEPTYLEWRLKVLLDRDLSHWTLDDIDIGPATTLEADTTIELSGRSLLSGSGSSSIADLLAAFIDEEENLDQAPGSTGVIDDDSLALLRDLDDAARFADILSASFDGLRDHLLGFSTNVRITESGTDGEILPDRFPELLRAGTATVHAVRVVDAFGRFLDVAAPYSVADPVEVPDGTGADAPDTFLLPPRIVAPSRLWLRFVDAADDTRDAYLDQEHPSLARNPVAAWLLPDHVDEALEVFDAVGEPLGQLRNERLGAGVVWEGAPGRPGPMGRAPFLDIADRHTAELARAMVERDAAERQAGADHGESTLDAFLRAVDTTLWTVDPFADSGLDYYAKMTGRPIAVVRARLLLDVVPDVGLFAPGDPRRAERQAGYDELSRRRFEVRLGSLAHADDGLLGYFVDDDYRHFYPVHASVPLEAVPGGRNTGFLAAAPEAETFDPRTPAPITHPYVVSDPTVDVQVGHPVRLTLLLDPGTRVHATCGLVPRKSIALPRAFVQDALARIAPSFRFGPLLVDPAVIRLPKPSVLPEDQVWTRRDTPTTWRDDPIEAATQFAHLPDTSHEAQEGYVRVHLEP